MRQNINRKYNSPTKSNVYLCLDISEIHKTVRYILFIMFIAPTIMLLHYIKRSGQWYITCRSFFSKEYLLFLLSLIWEKIIPYRDIFLCFKGMLWRIIIWLFEDNLLLKRKKKKTKIFIYYIVIFKPKIIKTVIIILYAIKCLTC